MKRFQIRDDDFGLALVEAADGREALLSFVCDRVRGEVRPTVEENLAGHAEVVYQGVRYRAIPAPTPDPGEGREWVEVEGETISMTHEEAQAWRTP